MSTGVRRAHIGITSLASCFIEGDAATVRILYGVYRHGGRPRSDGQIEGRRDLETTHSQ